MKKIISILSLFIMLSCTGLAQAKLPTIVLPVGENYILGITHYIPESQLINYIGEPTERYHGNINVNGMYKGPDKNKGGFNSVVEDKEILFYKGLGFIAGRFTNDPTHKKLVIATVIIDRSAVTKRGLAVGDSETKLLNLYDQPTDLDVEGGTGYVGNHKIKYELIYRYSVSTGNGVMDSVSLDMYVNKGKVVAITTTL